MKHISMLILIFITSCSGYKLTQRVNPFTQYGIRSIAIPTFYNRSNFSNVSGIFTQNIYKLLTEFSDLKVISGSGPADAVLVGIIESEDKILASSQSGNMRIANTVSGSTLGREGEFYIPASTNQTLSVQFIVVKNPTKEELELLHSPFSKNFKISSKIIFNEIIDASSSFNRELREGAGTAVNYTQNKGAERRNLNTIAEDVTNTFKEMILYAF